MTYPPAHHLLWDLQLRFAHDDDHGSRAWMPVTPEVCGDDGSVRAGALTTLVDVISGGLAARAAQPNWIATADLTVHMTGRAASGEVEARARVLRAGRTTVVLEIDVVDDMESQVAIATSSFAVLPRRDINPEIGERISDGFVGPEGAALQIPYADQLGIRVLDAAAGVVEVPVTDWSRNSMGAFQGGAVGAVLEAAAEAALRTASNTQLVVTDLYVTYLSFGRVGPLQTRTDVLQANTDRGVATVALFDTGAEMRTMTTARVVATRSLT